jgi:hypothetical protein
MEDIKMSDFIRAAQISERIKKAGIEGAGVEITDGVVTITADPETLACIEQNIDLSYQQPVPRSVPLWRIMAAIEATSPELYAAVEAMAAQDVALKNLFKFGGEIERSSPTIDMLAGQLELSSEEVDGLFIAAGALQL